MVKKRMFQFAAAAALGAAAFVLLASNGIFGAQRDCDYERKGLWTVCKRQQQLYFSIPRALLERELVLVETTGQLRAGIKESPVKYQLFRWQRRGDQMVAQLRDAQPYADRNGTLLDDTKTPSVWQDAAVLPIASGKRFGAMLVEATALFQGAGTLTGAVVDPAATQFARVLSFPRNVVIQTRTLVREDGSARVAEREWNFLGLPERPMLPRRVDPRHPFFTIDSLTGEVMLESDPPLRDDLALRWRLEKKHPDRAISEPIEPIVYYIDPTTPAKWRPYVKRAIEAWNVAFEEAGFRNAVIAKEAPTDDPEFGFDIRHTVLVWDSRQWLRRIFVDPRTGEILQGNLVPAAKGVITRGGDGYGNWLAKHFVRVAPVDPDAHRFPFDLDLEARLMAQVASHEMGHNLGLKDGNYGKGAYTVAEARDPSWVKRNGFTPSIMNYTRMNYVAQPGDGMPPELLIQQVGPADRYWIGVLYRPFPGTESVHDETRPMDALLAQLDTRPDLRFNEGADVGPDSAMEVVETDDPVASTRLGLDNLKRAIALVPLALAHGGDSARGDVVLLQKAAMSTWFDLMHHVVGQIGGYTQRTRGRKESGPVRTMVPAAAQRAAMRFLVDEALKPPHYLRDPAIARMLPEAWRQVTEDDLEAILAVQRTLLHEMVGKGHGFGAWQRLTRLANAESGSGRYVYPDNDRYTLTEYLADLRKGVWGQLDDAAVFIDPYRQGLQEAHLRALKDTLAIEKADRSAGEIRGWLGNYQVPLHAFVNAAIASELRTILKSLQAAEARADDPTTAAHLRRMQSLIGPS